MTFYPVGNPTTSVQPGLHSQEEPAEPSLSHLLANASPSPTNLSFVAIPIEASETITHVANTSLQKLREEYVCGGKLIEYIEGSDFVSATELLHSNPHIAAYRTTEGTSLLCIAWDSTIEKLKEKDLFLPQESLDFIYLLIHYHKPLMNELISFLNGDHSDIDFRPIFIDLIDKEMIDPTDLLVEMIFRGSSYFMGGYDNRNYFGIGATKNARCLAEIVINRMEAVDILTVHRELKSRCAYYNLDNMEQLNKLFGIDQSKVPSELIYQGCVIQ